MTLAAPLATLPLLLRVEGVVPLLRPTIDSLTPTSVVTGVMDGDVALTQRADAAALAGAADGWTYTDALRPGAHALTAARAP